MFKSINEIFPEYEYTVFFIWWMKTQKLSQLPYMWRLVEKNQHSSSTWKSHENRKIYPLTPRWKYAEINVVLLSWQWKKYFTVAADFYVCLIARVACGGLFWIFLVLLGNKTVTLREKRTEAVITRRDE